jgi:hypothetical protein
MKATAPFMSGFVLYLLSLGGGVMAIKQFRSYLYQSRYFLAFVFLIAAGFLFPNQYDYHTFWAYFNSYIYSNINYFGV